MYNFTICQGLSHDSLTPLNTFIYTWTELEGKKGSSEVVSCVDERLTNTTFPNHIHTVRFFADSYGGRNKNSTMVSMLLYWLTKEAPSHIKRVVLYFPIPGHSFHPPDRVFRNIERQINRKEEIILSDGYFSVFRKFGTILRPGVNVNFHDWKMFAQLKNHSSGTSNL